MGEFCGVFLLTNVDMGVFAMKSPSVRESFSGRLPLSPRPEARRPTVRLERLEIGEEDNAWSSDEDMKRQDCNRDDIPVSVVTPSRLPQQQSLWARFHVSCGTTKRESAWTMGTKVA